MAGAVADRAWRTTVPERIEADLAALWREVAGGESRVARAVMSNLVIFRDRRTPIDADPASIVAGLPIEEVASRHPSRMIVLEHCYDDTPAAPFSAAVGITTFGPPHARYGVEQIVVRSACPNAALLSILRRFVRGDLPTTVWWTEDLSTAPLLQPFVEVGRQLLYNSRQWSDFRRGAAAVVSVVANEQMDPADLNWRRLGPMRRALVHARGPLSSPAWDGAPVRIAAGAGEDALAWLCAGWLRGGRRAQDRALTTVEDTRGQTATAGRLLTVSIQNLTAALTDRGATVEGDATPLAVAAAVEDEADAIADELRSLARDTSLIGALRALLD